jgi:hypothetical protein
LSARDYLRLLGTAPRVARAVLRDPGMFARLADQRMGDGAAAGGFARSRDRLPRIDPLRLNVDPSRTPCLNVLLPYVGNRAQSGGPITAMEMGAQINAAGIGVRYIGTDDFVGTLSVSPHDVFLATAWWTAHLARAATQALGRERFVYLIQDDERLLHPASTESALALESYGFDALWIINSWLLDAHLFSEGLSRRTLAFQPAVDRMRFFPTPHGEKVLLFYCRPTHKRNLAELGLRALKIAVDAGLFRDGWTLRAIGEPIDAIDLGHGVTLQPTPWLGFDDYAALVRGADIMLAPMLSPHPGYPALEMAACNGVSVTTVYGVKTADALADLSQRIIGVAPTADGLAGGLHTAATAIFGAGLRLPASWKAAFRDIVPLVVGFVEQQMRA